MMDLPPPEIIYVWGPLGVFFFVVLGLCIYAFRRLFGTSKSPGIAIRVGESAIDFMADLRKGVDELREGLDEVIPAVRELRVSLASTIHWQEGAELAVEHFMLALSYQLHAKTKVIRATGLQLRATAYILYERGESVPEEFHSEMDRAHEELRQAAESVHKAQALLIRPGKRASHKDVNVGDSGIHQ